MFAPISFDFVGPLSEAEVTDLNGFLSYNPSVWASLPRESWDSILRHLKLSFDGLKVFPKDLVALPQALAYSFLVEDIESQIFLPKEDLNSFIQIINGGEDAFSHDQVTSVICECLVRKFLAGISQGWQGAMAPRYQFIGIEGAEAVDVEIPRAIACNVIFSGQPLNFFLSLPDEIFYRFCDEFALVSLLPSFEEVSLGSGECDLRIDFGSVSVPTKALIDIVRKNGLLELPPNFVDETVQVFLNDIYQCQGILKINKDKILVLLTDKKILDKKEVIDQHTSLTVSLGVSELQAFELRHMPRVLKLGDLEFPNVSLLVGNEVVARGRIGTLNSSALVVRVS